MKDSKWSRRELLTSVVRSTVLASAMPSIVHSASLAFRKPESLSGDHGTVWVLSSDTRWAGLNQVFNQDITASPYAIALCENDEDIITTLNYCQNHSLTFSIRNGGHSYMGFSLVNQGVVIDLSLIKAISSSTAGKVRITSGCTLGEIYQTMFKQYGSTVPGGSCESVGISGLTLGGGIGFLSRLHGLTSDALTRLEIIVSEKKQSGFKKVTASATENQDLFWACRGGGGGNFGLVTALEFQAQPIPEGKSIFAEINIPWQQDDGKDSNLIHCLGKAWMKAVNGFNKNARSDSKYQHFFSVLAFFSRNNSEGARILIWSFHNQSDIASTLYHEFLIGLDLDECPLADVSKQELPYIDVVRKVGDSGPLRSFYNNSGFCDSSINDDGLSVISRLILSKEYNTNQSETLLQFDSLGGKISEFSADYTAWPHRKAQFSLQFQSKWTDDSEKEDCKRWVDDFVDQLTPYLTGLCYCNYPSPRNDDYVERYYGAHWQRLIEIKTVWDPNNLFTVAQGIPVVKSAVSTE